MNHIKRNNSLLYVSYMSDLNSAALCIILTVLKVFFSAGSLPHLWKKG